MGRKALGSNQYKIRVASSQIMLADTDLMAQATSQVMGSADQMRCGEVWGTSCRAWVYPPRYSHNTHGLDGSLTKLANTPNCPEWAQRLLADSADDRVRINLAANPGCIPDLLLLLANDHTPKVRRTAVSNPQCPLEGLWLAARSPKSAERRNLVYYNHTCPPEIMTYLSRDKSIRVREAVALNRTCPAEVLDQMADNESAERLLWMIAGNPNTNTSTLHKILRRTSECLYSYPLNMRLNISRNPNADPQWLDSWARQGYTRSAVPPATIANNPSTQASTLVYLLELDNQVVTDLVLKHHNCPEEYKVLGNIVHVVTV